MRALIIACAIVVALCGSAVAHARAQWITYHAPNRIVVIRAQCMGAEDSAAHLRLRVFSARYVRYTCARTGY